jgi:predicted PurR-regulated permease PerM
MVSEYYLKPKLVGDRVKIHVLLIFISIFGGLTTFGLLGVLFGPLITIGFLSLVEIYHQNYGKHLL